MAMMRACLLSVEFVQLVLNALRLRSFLVVEATEDVLDQDLGSLSKSWCRSIQVATLGRRCCD